MKNIYDLLSTYFLIASTGTFDIIALCLIYQFLINGRQAMNDFAGGEMVSYLGLIVIVCGMAYIVLSIISPIISQLEL